MSARAATWATTAVGGATTLLLVVASFYAPPGRGVFVLVGALVCTLTTAVFLDMLRSVDR
jgi:hypothetical protein